MGERAFSVAAPQLWNCIPLEIKKSKSPQSFRKKLKLYISAKPLHPKSSVSRHAGSTNCNGKRTMIIVPNAVPYRHPDGLGWWHWGIPDLQNWKEMKRKTHLNPWCPELRGAANPNQVHYYSSFAVPIRRSSMPGHRWFRMEKLGRNIRFSDLFFISKAGRGAQSKNTFHPS